MSRLEILADAIKARAQVLSPSWKNGKEHENRWTTFPILDTASDEARNHLLGALKELEQLVLGPKDTLQSWYYKGRKVEIG
jgi:hypothetical protein